MAKIFCSNCGKALSVPEGRAFTFCTECGTKVEVPAAFAAAPKVEAPVVEPPKAEPPVVEPPVIEKPVVETPAVEKPVVEAPIVEKPVVETPVIEKPVVETPAPEPVKVEEPKFEAPKPVERPAPQPQPAPQPAPAPQPRPQPVQQPAPRPAPAPQPRPQPRPQPVQQPAPQPAPAQAAQPKKKKTGLIIGIIAGVVALLLAAAAVFMFVLKPGMDYSAAQKLLEDKSYEEATAAFEKLGNYKDSALKADEARVGQAVKLVSSGKFDKAAKLLKEIESDEVDYAPLNGAVGDEIAKLASEGDNEGVAEALDAMGKYIKDPDAAICAGVASLIDEKSYYTADSLIRYLSGEDSIEDIKTVRAAVTEKFKALVADLSEENLEDATNFFYGLGDYIDDVSGIANEKIGKLLDAGKYEDAKKLVDYIYWSIENPAKAVVDKANDLIAAGDLEGAVAVASVVAEHNEYKAIMYAVADKYFENEDYATAAEIFSGLGWYEDSESRAKAARAKIALDLTDKEDLTSEEYAEVYGALVDQGADQDVIDAFVVRWTKDVLEKGDTAMATKLYYNVTLSSSAEADVYGVVVDNIAKVATVDSEGKVTANEDQIDATKEILDLFNYYYEDVAELKTMLTAVSEGKSISADAVKALWDVKGLEQLLISELGLSGAITGTWRSEDGEHSIEMTERSNGTYNFNYELPAGDLPSNTASWYMGGHALVLTDSDGKDIQEFFTFAFEDYDHMTVYCVNTDTAVDLVRQS